MNVKGTLAVVGGFLIHLTLGTFFTIGNMAPYLISYLKQSDTTVSHGMAIWINALSYVGQGSLMSLGGVMEKRLGGRLTCIIGCCLFCGSIALTSVTVKHNFWAMVSTYGLISCFGLSIAYIAPLSIGMRWFPNQKGLVNGIILSGYGLGALVFNPVQTALLNSRNISPNNEGYFVDRTILDKLPNTLIYLSAIYGAIQIIGVLILFPAPRRQKNKEKELQISTISNTMMVEKPDKMYGKDAMPPPELATKSSLTLIRSDLSPFQAFKTKEFYMLWFTFALHAQCVQFINTYYKTYGQTFIRDDLFLSIVGSAGSACNALGRIFWGRLQDKTSYKLAMLIISFNLTAIMFTFILIPYGGKPMFTIWVMAGYLSFGGVFPLMAAAAALAFGSKHAGTNFGVLYSAPAISSVIGAIVIQLLLNSVGWLAVFCTIGGLTCIGFIITIFMPSQLEIIR